MISDMASGLVSMLYGFKGPNFTAVSACASAANAIGSACLLIQAGHCDAMVTGGSEAAITLMSMAGFCAMKAMSVRNAEPTRASRPFDAGRDGFVMGEGAGILVLERLDVACERGAPILGEVVGFGMTGDAYHMTAPSPEGEGAARAMQAALDMARVEPGVVDYINAHGTSTELGDLAEVKSIHQVFGEHAHRLAVSSTKSSTGHLLGAAGGLESGILGLAIRHQIMPATINLDEPGPECDLDFVPHTPRQARIEVGITNSFGFGGTNGALVMRRFAA
jgi:3-oxoacyl-[acyl-carrier-protein] synthase II